MACSLLFACATEKYVAKPLNIEKTTATLLSKDITSPAFKNYLIQQGYQEKALPFDTWGLDELTLCALYFHPKLTLAKAHLALANAQIATAGAKQNPTLNTNVARSNQKNGDSSPWAFGLNVEIPIETANKREIKIEEAHANASVSRMDIADTAWQLRNQIARDLLEYQLNIASMQLLQNELTTQTEISHMLQKRIDSGLASSVELSNARLNQLKAQSILDEKEAKSTEMLAQLASDVGLSAEKFMQIHLKSLDLKAALERQASALEDNIMNKNLQASTLLNRVDIRRSLAKYAVAEAKIKLEVAKQTADINLSPGIAFEFGNAVWSLGYSALLHLLNQNSAQNSAQINEAKQLREIEGAQFELLQAQIIGDLQLHYASYKASQQRLNQTQSQLKSQLQLAQKLQKQFDAGLIDRLALKQASLSNHLAEQQVLAAQFEALQAANDIENTMQAPLTKMLR